MQKIFQEILRIIATFILQHKNGLPQCAVCYLFFYHSGTLVLRLLGIFYFCNSYSSIYSPLLLYLTFCFTVFHGCKNRKCLQNSASKRGIQISKSCTRKQIAECY